MKLDGPLDYDAWCEGIARGRAYVSDGRSHIMDFTADRFAMGGELRRDGPGTAAPGGSPPWLNAMRTRIGH